MPYLTTYEQFARQEGRQEGLHQGRLVEAYDAIFDALEARFEPVPAEMKATMRMIKDLSRLKELRRPALRVVSLGEFQALLQ